MAQNDQKSAGQVLKELWLGVEKSPAAVAAFRGLLLYAIPTVIDLVAVGVTQDPRFALFLPLLPFVRVLEGVVVDQLHKASQNDTYPNPPAGETK